MINYRNLHQWYCFLILFVASGLQAKGNLETATKGEPSNIIPQVMIEVNNVPEGNKALPGSNGLVEIKRGLFSRKEATRDRIAVFDNIPGGKAYTLSIFNRSNSSAFDNTVEFWGQWQKVIIDHENPRLSLTRHMPYIFNIQPRRSAAARLNPAFEVGDTIKIDLTIKNPSPYRLKSTAVVKLRSLSSSKTHKIEKEITLEPHENNKRVVLHFVAAEAGGYAFAPGIFVKQAINQWTDCWDWSEDPFFYVVEQHRYLEFAGHLFYVKAGFGNPGGNYWSDDTSHVWIDEKGGLNLTLAKKKGKWYSSEVISKGKFSYGTYTFYFTAQPALYDPHVVAGIFLYYDDVNEIDIEFSRWGDAENHNFGNYVIQPADYPGNHFRFPLLTNDTITTHQIIWRPESISFLSWRGHSPYPQQDNIISGWEYTGKDIPKGGALQLFFNLWLFRGTFPQNDRTETFTINHFTFTSSEEN